MKAKDLIIRILGDGATDRIVSLKKTAQSAMCKLRGREGEMVFADGRPFSRYGIDKKNVFFGYYDLAQYSPDGGKLLAHIVDKDADPALHSASLAWFARGEAEPHVFAQTSAWCWQQGARLRWHPLKTEHALYNDVQDGAYVAKECNVRTGETHVIAPCALYDLTPDFSTGLSLNFSRLQRLRPGYGYDRLPDPYQGIEAPAEDGIVLVDLKTGSKRQIIALSELAAGVEGRAMHYINHISVSPKGERFTFFHLWTNGQRNGRKVRFYSCDLDGSHLKLLDDQIQISHYGWEDDQHMIVTSCDGRYARCDVVRGKMEMLVGERLRQDGHPSSTPGGFLSDTYPRKDHMQYVFQCKADGSGYRELARFFSEPRLHGERRCDLHPRYSKDGMVTVDTTAVGGVRSMISFPLDPNEK